MQTLYSVVSGNILFPGTQANPDVEGFDGKYVYIKDERHSLKIKHGRYLRRLFKKATDEQIELLQMPFGGKCSIIEDEEMVDLMESGDGPGSCMSDKHFSDVHPYSVYSSRLGWGLAVMMIGDECVARALVNYYRYSTIYGNKTLQLWLEQEGYSKASNWNGERIELIYHDEGGIVCPYIDGPACELKECREGLKIVYSDGEYKADSQYGRVERCICCDECGASGREIIYVDDDPLCSDCWVYSETMGMNIRRDDDTVDVVDTHGDDDFVTPAYARRYCVEITAGEYAGKLAHNCYTQELYDGKRAHENDAVELTDGSFALEEDCTRLNGEWYLDSDIVESYDRGRILKKDSTVAFDGEIFHKDSKQFTKIPKEVRKAFEWNFTRFCPSSARAMGMVRKSSSKCSGKSTGCTISKMVASFSRSA